MSYEDKPVPSVSQDRFGRMINYLRISLTDKCNLRCVYCMPEDMVFRPNRELMQDDELELLVRVFADLGFKKFRLTGGEPTVRQNIVEICRYIAHTPGVKSLSDYFIDQKIEPTTRARTPLLCDRLGLIWVMGQRIDERVRLRPETRRVLRLVLSADSAQDSPR